MDNLKILIQSPDSDKIKITNSNLWSEVCKSRKDAEFWANHFSARKVPFVMAQFDVTLLNKNKQKMHRRVYGVFVDMSKWQAENV
jgi:hypothetical protein